MRWGLLAIPAFLAASLAVSLADSANEDQSLRIMDKREAELIAAAPFAFLSRMPQDDQTEEIDANEQNVAENKKRKRRKKRKFKRTTTTGTTAETTTAETTTAETTTAETTTQATTAA